MAAVTNPTAEQIIGWTGLNTFIEGASQAGFCTWLSTLVPDAEAKVAVAVGEGRFDSDWTARKALLLSRAIAYEVAALALVSPELQKVTGTHEPLLMEDAEEIAAVERRMQVRAAELISLATQGAEEAAPFALPAVGSGAFSVADGDRSPADKNSLLDERDDIAADDTEHG